MSDEKIEKLSIIVLELIKHYSKFLGYTTLNNFDISDELFCTFNFAKQAIELLASKGDIFVEYSNTKRFIFTKENYSKKDELLDGNLKNVWYQEVGQKNRQKQTYRLSMKRNKPS